MKNEIKLKRFDALSITVRLLYSLISSMPAELSKLEKNALIAEYNWFLQNELPSFVETLNTVLESCLSKFFLREPSNTIASPEKYTFTSPTNPDSIKGSVTVFQNFVLFADLQIRYSSGASQVIRANIREDEPWKIKQIQDCGNHIKNIYTMISNPASELSFTESSDILNFIESIQSTLNHALTSLNNPENLTTEDFISDAQRRIFNPPLLNEHSIIFQVSGSQLLLFATVSKFVVEVGKKPDPSTQSFLLREIIKKYGKVETTHSIVGKCSIPWLDSVIDTIYFALDQCQMIHSKVLTFEEYSITSSTTNI